MLSLPYTLPLQQNCGKITVDDCCKGYARQTFSKDLSTKGSTIYKPDPSNIIHNEYFPSEIRKKTKCTFPPLLFNYFTRSSSQCN